ncbi:unnamed protein product [Eruca vesicaria subsp. sativa]|uniref:F-box domain-containing protein n=1 Tax=Eruca vesicaria subsp. sativa TaxID=29727 RepID=A0ABC8KDI5_ERUVS|nr:unnamed protein product [Eruca vesicaria subsp. sativa]
MSSKAKKRSLEQPPCVLPSLPQDIIDDIVAHVPRWYYPKLSLVSKHFRSLVASPEIYARRSLLGCKENCLYVLLHNEETHKRRWYILRKNSNGIRSLVLIPSLSAMPFFGSFVALGSSIYVFGGIDSDNMTTKVLRIDCRSHMVQTLPSIPIRVVNTYADIIDGKIYVIGRHFQDYTTVIFVFSTETQVWQLCLENLSHRCYCVVVMGDKIYMSDSHNSFVYDPKENKLERDEILNINNWQNACVLDDVLHYYDCSEEKISRYDPNRRCWRVVDGLEELLAVTRCSEWSNIVTYNGKLLLFFGKGNTSEVWCAGISLERRQGGEIWGQVEWREHLVTGRLLLDKSLAVMV